MRTEAKNQSNLGKIKQNNWQALNCMLKGKWVQNVVKVFPTYNHNSNISTEPYIFQMMVYLSQEHSIALQFQEHLLQKDDTN